MGKRKMSDRLEEVVVYETDDGSMTLHDRERNIHYRSYHGAISESRHVFLGATGITEVRGTWRVAELGFGAAVNFRQTVEAFRQSEGAESLRYHSVDWRPVTASHLEFHEGEAGEMAREAVRRVHDHEGSDRVCITSDDGAIELWLYAQPFEEVDLSAVEAQAFYQDPFAKRVNPEGWSVESFGKARQAMDKRGRLATYSAATSVKRALFKAGFSVATAPGPGRKREMTVASPSREVLEEAGLEILSRDKYVSE